MYKNERSNTWFGKLATPSQEIVVIHDKRVICSTEGRVFLYHTGRQKIVEFVESIAEKNLIDVSDHERNAIKKQYGKEWENIFSEYKKKHIDIFKKADKETTKITENALEEEVDTVGDEDVNFDVDDLDSEDDRKHEKII